MREFHPQAHIFFNLLTLTCCAKLDIYFFIVYIPGYYCDNSIEPIGDLTNYTCPLGHYCPGLTEYDNQYPCPSGTFNNRTGMVNSSDCQQCTPGYYCRDSGLPQPQGLCFPG